MSSAVGSTAVPVPDAAIRRAALDPAGSFIVQAPAGSGKTELLTQRFLALLGVAERPEAILAMTFTRKAAGEMRSRIMQQLRWAAAHPVADAHWPPHQQLAWQLAQGALARDRERGWHLLDHPARLRIHTIDAFCSSLVLQMPYLSRLGGMARTAEDASVLYHEAARATVQALEDGDDGLGEALFCVLGYLDNQRSRLQQLLADMLARRDQWVRHLRPAAREPDGDEQAFRNDLEAVLRDLARQGVETLLGEYGTDWLDALQPQLAYAAACLRDSGSTHALLSLGDWPDTGQDAADCLPALQTIAAYLLTTEGRLRQKLDIRCGFPPDGTHHGRDAKLAKQAMGELLDGLRQRSGFEAALQALGELPGIHIPEGEWQFFRALRRILLHALGELTLVFAARGEIDFSEVALSALRALGDEEDPTDLAIRKDQQIHHILVDEFQDTSHTQFGLLRRLTREWQPGDGRSVFLVGDPMQSIYRFREGDVGLFLRVREHGFGAPGEPAGVHPQFLELTANFRSDAGIIDWVNGHFAQIFPDQEDMGLGAIRYAASSAIRPAREADPVAVHPFIEDDGRAEAEAIAGIVLERLPQLPDDDCIAILVRARSHLVHIAAALHRHGLPFQAVEIEALADKQGIEDLLALTRAILHPADREAWLACLRAPWCALRLAELETLMHEAGNRTVWECLQDASRWQGFGDDSRLRLQRFTGVMQRAWLARSRQPLRTQVEAAWVALGGPAVLLEGSGFDDAEAFFRLLEALQQTADDVALELPEALQALYAAPNAAPEAARIKLMTIHAAKGLQFDTVILPGLHKAGRRDDKRLLHWQQFTLEDCEDALLIAPLDGSGESSGLYRFLTLFEKRKAQFELQRLLYVAVTRAKNRLHLLASARPDKDGTLKEPATDTLLAPLWPMLWQRFADLPPPAAAAETVRDGFVPKIAALRPQWALPPVPPEAGIAVPQRPVLEPYRGDGPDHWRTVGSLVHAYLELVHRTGVSHWDAARVLALQPVVESRLRAQGVGARYLGWATAKVMNALASTLGDPVGRWLLDNRHEDSHAELELYCIEPQATTTHVVDRSFVEGGIRWIADYKTSEPAQGQSLDAFLTAQQQAYREQLERYAALFRQQEGRPIRLLLYFPLLALDVRWEYPG